MLDEVVSVAKGIVSVIAHGVSKVFGMMFVTDGYVTSTTKAEDKKVKSDLTPEKTQDLSDLQAEYWLTLWSIVEESASKALAAGKKVLYATGNMLKEIFWTLHIKAAENIKNTYIKYWNLASTRYDPAKQKNMTEEVNKKKNKMTVDLAKIASAVPGFEAISAISDALNKFAEIVSTSYHDLSDPKIDPTAPILSLIDLIKPLTEAFEPLEDFAGGSIPEGLLELPALLDSLLKVNKSTSSKKKTIRKYNSEIPSKFKDACEAFTKAIESMSIKSVTFIILVICKIIEVIVEIIRVISDLIAGPAMPLIDELIKPISAVLKAVPIAYSLVSEAPLAIKVIGDGTIRNLMAIGTNEMFDEFPDEIDINLLDTNLISILNVEPTDEDLKEAIEKYGVDSTEANEIRQMMSENYSIDLANEVADNIEQSNNEYLAELDKKYASTSTNDVDDSKYEEVLTDEEVKKGNEEAAKAEAEYIRTGTVTPNNDLANVVGTDTTKYNTQPNTINSTENSAIDALNSKYADTTTLNSLLTTNGYTISKTGTVTPQNDADDDIVPAGF